MGRSVHTWLIIIQCCTSFPAFVLGMPSSIFLIPSFIFTQPFVQADIFQLDKNFFILSIKTTWKYISHFIYLVWKVRAVMFPVLHWFKGCTLLSVCNIFKDSCFIGYSHCLLTWMAQAGTVLSNDKQDLTWLANEWTQTRNTHTHTHVCSNMIQKWNKLNLVWWNGCRTSEKES